MSDLGIYALGNQRHLTAADVRAMDPLSAAQGRALAAACARVSSPEVARQLANIDRTIAASGLSVVPEPAASILRNAVIRSLFPGEEVVGGDEAIGMFDILAEQRKMNDLKIVTPRVARALLQGGQQAIQGAIEQASMKLWRRGELPGKTARDNVFWKLKWHEAEIAKLTDPNAIYKSFADLKKWVMQGFIEANAVEEGSAVPIWGAMWEEIKAALAAIPSAVVDGLKAAAKKIEDIGDTAAFYTKVSFWVALGAVGLVGYGGYKLLASQGASNVLGTYLAVRRR